MFRASSEMEKNNLVAFFKLNFCTKACVSFKVLGFSFHPIHDEKGNIIKINNALATFYTYEEEKKNSSLHQSTTKLAFYDFLMSLSVAYRNCFDALCAGRVNA